MPETDQSGIEEKARTSARKFILILALVFTLMPLFLLVRDHQVLKVIDRVVWKKVPCEIISAGVERIGRDSWYPYEPVVRYRYVVGGAQVESESVGEARYALYDEAAAAVRQLRQG